MATDGDGAECQEVPLDTWVEAQGFRTHYFRTGKLPGGWNTFAFSEAYRRTLRREVRRADMVHIYSLYNYPGLWAGIYARRGRVPYVLEPHGTLDSFLFGHHKWRKRLYELLAERRSFRSAAAIRFLSGAEASMARSNLGMPFKGAAVIPSGIEPGEFQPSHGQAGVLANYTVPRDRRLIMFVGRLHRKKGVDLLLRAFVQLARTDSTVHLVIVGPDDGMEQSVRALAEAGQMVSRVTFTGMVTGQSKIDLMAAATIMVIPSHTENFCNVAIESMALGVPLVVSNGVGIAGQIEQGGAGVVAAPEAEAIEAAIRRIIDDPAALKRLGIAGRVLASGSFAWSVVGAKMDKLYRDIIESQPAA